MTISTETDSASTSYRSIALDLTVLTALAGALLYVAGFVRLFYFMNHFQASMFILDVPVELYLVHGFFVFIYAWWLTIPLLLVVSITLGLRGVPVGRCHFDWRPLIPLGSIIALSLVMIYMAKPSANQDYESQKKHGFSEYHPRVQIWLKPTSPDGSAVADWDAFLSQGCYRLLLQTEKTLYLFAHPPTAQLEPWPVLTMSLDEIVAMRGLPQDETPRCSDWGRSEPTTLDME